MEIITIYFILIFIYLVYSFILKNKKFRNDQIKGPIALPFFGNIIGLRDNPYAIMDNYHNKYGGIFRLWFGDYHCVSINDPEIIREMFIKNHYNFSQRPILPTITFSSFNYRGISGSNGDHWKRNRSFLISAMKKTNLKQTYENLTGQVNSFIKLMHQFEKTNQHFDPDMFLRKFGLSTMFKYLFDETLSFEFDKNVDGQEAEIIGLIDDAFRFMKVGHAGDFLTVLQPFYYKYLAYKGGCFDKFKSFIRDRYKIHYKTIDREKPRDLMDQLIIEYGEQTEESIVSIVQVCFDLFLAGTDTVANTLEWLMLLLCNHKEIQEKSYKELKQVVSNENRTNAVLSDRPSTIFTVACIKESTRLKAPAPFGLPHNTEEDIIIKDYFIPKGTMVIMNHYSLGRNPKDFPNPLVFDPNRFIGPTPDSYLPFGVGIRSCIGQGLALDQIYLLLSNILLNFKLSSIDGQMIDDSDTVSGLNLRPNLFKLSLEKRS